jgi:hypothetical protein
MKIMIPTLTVVLALVLAVPQSHAAAAGGAAPAGAAAAAPSAAGNPIANQPNPGMGMGIGGAPAPAMMNQGPALPRTNPGASVPATTPNPAATTFGNNQIGVPPGSTSSMRGTAGMNGFGSVNSRTVVSPTTPGRAANMPGPPGSANTNSAFQPAASPFVQNPQAASATGLPSRGAGVGATVGMPLNRASGLAGLPASAFTTQVARPTPPGPTSSPSNPSFFPLYLPNGAVNQYVGPNAPMANGQVNGQLNATQALQAAQQNAAQNGMVFQNGQWWHQAPGGYWEYYRGNRWNSLPAAAGERAKSTSTPTSNPTSSGPTSTSGATPTYSYDVPGYSP